MLSSELPAKKPMNPADRRSTFAGALAVFTAGGLFWAFLPLFIGLQSEALQISSTGAGALGSTYLAGFSLMSISALLWVPRANWRYTLVAAGLTVIAGFCTVYAAQNYITVLLACLVIGIGMGAKWAISYRLFGATSNPDRAFGLSIAISYSLLAAIVFVLGRFIVGRYGLDGAVLFIVSAVAVLTLGAYWVPANLSGGGRPSGAAISYKPPLAVALALAGILLGGLGIAAIWAFVERIGAAAGFSAEQIGPVLSGNLLAIGAGSLLASAIAARIPRLLLLSIGYLVLLGSLWCLLDIAEFGVYALAITAFGLGTGFVMPLQMATLASVDQSGRFVVLIAAAQGFGSALGPLLGGLAGDSGGRAALVATGAIIFLLSYTLFVLIRRTATAPQSN